MAFSNQQASPTQGKSSIRLKVIIIGAGIGGTAAAVTLCQRGHDVLLLETAPKMLEIGAGIQVAPNMLRLLDRWGVGAEVRKNGVILKEVRILRWQDGSELGRAPVNLSLGEQVVVHRADLHNALLDKAATMSNFRLQLSATVTDVNFENGSVVLSSGETIFGDVVIAADGIKSSTRAKMLGDRDDVAIPTGDAVYRLMLDRNQMVNDPDLSHFIENPKAIRWIGPGGHIIAYPIRGHQQYNIVMAHPDKGGVDESWTKAGSKQALLDEYAGWDPSLRKMLQMVPEKEVLEWKLCSHPPLKTWVSGTCALLGDACHPMLPYIAQGAAQAVEDAAALGVLLSNLRDKSQIHSALEVYQRARKARAERVQALGTTNQTTLHLPDGPEQIARDEKFRMLSSISNSPDKWGDRETQQFLWDWDSELSATQAWTESGFERTGKL